MIWFTSDTHFGHSNIIKYSERPFSTIEEHDSCFIDNINKVVKSSDVLYHLGDFVFCKNHHSAIHSIERITYALNCKTIHLRLGNHDHAIRKAKDYLLQHRVFASVLPYEEIKVSRDTWKQSHDITLCHYAMKVWNKSHRGALHLYGHSHSSLPDDPNSLSFDVGVDSCLFGHARFTPYSMDEVDHIMNSFKKFVPIDHHTGNYNE